MMFCSTWCVVYGTVTIIGKLYIVVTCLHRDRVINCLSVMMSMFEFEIQFCTDIESEFK